MKRLIIKVCGMRDAENIRQVEQLGIDWMGFICWNGSSRFVGQRPSYLPSACRRVGVFVNPSPNEIQEKVTLFGVDIVQLHGKETPALCDQVKRLRDRNGQAVKVIKAFSIAPGQPFPGTAAYEPVCDYFLFDTRCATVGGSGKTFDWECLEQYRGNRPFLLSGGIGEEHVDKLKGLDHPMWTGIDLNSRFEDSPAMKNVERLKVFINQIRKQSSI